MDLEAAGDAVVFYPDNMQAESTERRLGRLLKNYAAGAQQFDREWDSWLDFLGCPLGGVRGGSLEAAGPSARSA